MSKEQRLGCDNPHKLKKTMVDVILFLKIGLPRSLFGLFKTNNTNLKRY